MKKTAATLKPGDAIKFFGTVASVKKCIDPGSPGEFDDAEYYVITVKGNVFPQGRGAVRRYVTWDITETFDVV